MSHSKGVTYVMSCGDNIYYREAKVASDANEKAFRLAAMGAEAAAAGVTQNKVRSGKIQQKTDAPKNGIKV